MSIHSSVHNGDDSDDDGNDDSNDDSHDDSNDDRSPVPVTTPLHHTILPVRTLTSVVSSPLKVELAASVVFLPPEELSTSRGFRPQWCPHHRNVVNKSVASDLSGVLTTGLQRRSQSAPADLRAAPHQRGYLAGRAFSSNVVGTSASSQHLGRNWITLLLPLSYFFLHISPSVRTCVL